MRRRREWAAVLALATLGAGGARGADGFDAMGRVSGLSDPTLSSDAVEKTSIALTAEEEGSAIVANLVWGVEGDWFVALKARAPLDKAKKETLLANLDGLSSDASATLKVSRAWWRVGAPKVEEICSQFNATLEKPGPIDLESGCSVDGLGRAGQAALVAEASRTALVKVCTEYNAAGRGKPLLPAAEGDSRDFPQETFQAVCSADAIAEIDRKEIAAGRQPSPSALGRGLWASSLAKAMDEALLQVCRRENAALPIEWIPRSDCSASALISKGSPWKEKVLDDAGFKRPVLFSIFGTVADQTFEFLDPATFEEVKDSKAGSAFGVSLGTLFFNGTYLGASYRRQRAFVGSDPVEVCRAAEVEGALVCTEGAIGGPSKREVDIVQVEGRRFLSDDFAAIVRLSRDLDADVTGYQLLLYGLWQEDKGLTGGIDLGFRDDEDRISIRAFVGLAFGLLQ